jgi:hypothetical protein
LLLTDGTTADSTHYHVPGQRGGRKEVAYDPDDPKKKEYVQRHPTFFDAVRSVPEEQE